MLQVEIMSLAKAFTPRNGMRYSRHPLPKMWKVTVCGITAFVSGLYAYDMHWEKMMQKFELDTGDIHLYPMTDVPDVWDEHIKRNIPMRKFEPLGHKATEITSDTVRPIRGIEDVEGAPIWSNDEYNKIIYYKKSE